ncbi:hypothetical protein JKA74_12110 [Marivirga sp. S37H4]|uniref:DUF2007 domain-containing protein n=1 Tax=Marivirga aurantiaca TaxID=2802615 RepID=A0A935C901_9BACT|nr:DUF2007 domain-containing protein [Marivirga aurantiaca]MBK6265780.1 hypothetical protein [Marivirga aurantiaca]
MAKWQSIFTTDKLYRAEIVKDFLSDQQLQPIIVDKKDSAYQLGHFEVMVTSDEVLRAIKIIENEIKFE